MVVVSATGFEVVHHLAMVEAYRGLDILIQYLSFLFSSVLCIASLLLFFLPPLEIYENTFSIWTQVIPKYYTLYKVRRRQDCKGRPWVFRFLFLFRTLQPGQHHRASGRSAYVD